MSPCIDSVMVVLILTNLVVLGSSRLNTCIRVIALQGVMLATLPLMGGEGVLDRAELGRHLLRPIHRHRAFPGSGAIPGPAGENRARKGGGCDGDRRLFVDRR